MLSDFVSLFVLETRCEVSLVLSGELRGFSACSPSVGSEGKLCSWPAPLGFAKRGRLPIKPFLYSS